MKQTVLAALVGLTLTLLGYRAPQPQQQVEEQEWQVVTSYEPTETTPEETAPETTVCENGVCTPVTTADILPAASVAPTYTPTTSTSWATSGRVGTYYVQNSYQGGSGVSTYYNGGCGVSSYRGGCGMSTTYASGTGTSTIHYTAAPRQPLRNGLRGIFRRLFCR